MNKEQIKQLAQDAGFKLKNQPNGDFDLNPYVYSFAESLLNSHMQQPSPFTASIITASIDVYNPSVKQDSVDHPKHYTSDPSGIECIEITRHRNFNVGNAMKYLWRNGLKDSDAQIEDLQKAIWYIQDEIKRLNK